MNFPNQAISTYAELGNISWSSLLPEEMKKKFVNKKPINKGFKKNIFNTVIKYLSKSSRSKYIIDLCFSLLNKTIYSLKYGSIYCTRGPKPSTNLNPKDSYANIFYYAKNLSSDIKNEYAYGIDEIKSELKEMISLK